MDGREEVKKKRVKERTKDKRGSSDGRGRRQTKNKREKDKSKMERKMKEGGNKKDENEVE